MLTTLLLPLSHSQPRGMGIEGCGSGISLCLNYPEPELLHMHPVHVAYPGREGSVEVVLPNNCIHKSIDVMYIEGEKVGFHERAWVAKVDELISWHLHGVGCLKI